MHKKIWIYITILVLLGQNASYAAVPPESWYPPMRAPQEDAVAYLDLLKADAAADIQPLTVAQYRDRARKDAKRKTVRLVSGAIIAATVFYYNYQIYRMGKQLNASAKQNEKHLQNFKDLEASIEKQKAESARQARKILEAQQEVLRTENARQKHLLQLQQDQIHLLSVQLAGQQPSRAAVDLRIKDQTIQSLKKSFEEQAQELIKKNLELAQYRQQLAQQNQENIELKAAQKKAQIEVQKQKRIAEKNRKNFSAI